MAKMPISFAISVKLSLKMAKVQFMIASCILAVVLVATIAIDLGEGASGTALNCRFNENVCSRCCEAKGGKLATAKLIKKKLHKNVCECTRPGEDTAESLESVMVYLPRY